MRQRGLGVGHRFVQRIAQIVLDQRDEFLESVAFDGVAQIFTQLANHVRRFHQRELIPLRKTVMEISRHLKDFVDAFVLGAMPELRQNRMLQNAVIEHIPRHRHARMRQRNRFQRAAWACARLKTNDRKIAGATAKIGDQHGRSFGQSLCKKERRCNRFVDVRYLLKTDILERSFVALQRQRFVGIHASECDWATGNEMQRQLRERGPRMRAHALDERSQQGFEGEFFAVNMRLSKRFAGCKRLERLQKTAVGRVVNKSLNRPRPRLKTQVLCGVRVFFPKAHRRAKRGVRMAIQREWQHLRTARR